MRRVTIAAIARGLTPVEAYQRISDFARYVELTTTVREVVVHPADPDGSVVSDWTVHFRNGLLCWTERDTFDPQRLTIHFNQLSGDFERFEGDWLVEPAGAGARVVFDAVFDLGMPTLADILDPVAAATLQDNILVILHGLLGDIERVAELELAGTGHD
jgi:ribosome-associated toxin RatA of RatAB toxin-antitoxin module